MEHSLEILNKDKVILYVYWEHNKIHSVWKAEPHIKIPKYIYPENITLENLLKWMETRVVPRTRFGIEDILKEYGLPEYHPYWICKQTHGITMSDYLWVRFEGETLKYDDIAIRQ